MTKELEGECTEVTQVHPDAEVNEIEEKILFMLGIYPIMTHTMLQIALGTDNRSSTWRPILNKLVDEGKVIIDEIPRKTPKGQHRSYTRIYLPLLPAPMQIG